MIRHFKTDARSGLTEEAALGRLSQIGRNEVQANIGIAMGAPVLI